jgi:hypothetical protein
MQMHINPAFINNATTSKAPSEVQNTSFFFYSFCSVFKLHIPGGASYTRTREIATSNQIKLAKFYIPD